MDTGLNPHIDALIRANDKHDLLPEHVEDLRRSGLSDATIARHHFRSVERSFLGGLLGFQPPSVKSALFIPFPSPRGGFMNHVRVKVFPPSSDDGGHTVKYLQPKGSGVRLFFALDALPDVVANKKPLWIIEGEKKALAVAQLGFAAVGICGVDGWHAGSSHELLPDFDVIPLERRIIEVVPDGDVATNRSVRRAVERLGAALRRLGGVPRLVVLPETLAS